MPNAHEVCALIFYIAVFRDGFRHSENYVAVLLRHLHIESLMLLILKDLRHCQPYVLMLGIDFGYRGATLHLFQVGGEILVFLFGHRYYYITDDEEIVFSHQSAR